MFQKQFSDSEILALAKWIKILCEPNRLLLLEKIMNGVQCNCELGDELKIPSNLVSHHLSILKDSGLINAERNLTDARWIYYSIDIQVMDQIELLFANFFNSNRVQPRKNSCKLKIKDK